MKLSLKTLMNLKTDPSRSPLAGVRDLSPPTNGGKRSRNGGIVWGHGWVGSSYYDDYILRKRRSKKWRRLYAR